MAEATFSSVSLQLNYQTDWEHRSSSYSSSDIPHLISSTKTLIFPQSSYISQYKITNQINHFFSNKMKKQIVSRDLCTSPDPVIYFAHSIYKTQNQSIHINVGKRGIIYLWDPENCVGRCFGCVLKNQRWKCLNFVTNPFESLRVVWDLRFTLVTIVTFVKN